MTVLPYLENILHRIFKNLIFIYILDYFNTLILKIKKNIILIYFNINNTLKIIIITLSIRAKVNPMLQLGWIQDSRESRVDDKNLHFTILLCRPHRACLNFESVI